MTERSWGETPQDFTGEPKNVFCNFLIWNLKNIAGFLYYNRRFAAAIGPLMETIDSLDEKSQKKLETQRKELDEICFAKKPLREADMYRIYRDVAAYLHETYLQEVRFAKPKYPTKKLELPK